MMHFGNPSGVMRLPMNSARRAFTLVEILVVISIIALLAGLTISNFGHTFDNSRIDVAKLFVNQSIKTPLTTFSIHMGGYPTTDEGLAALMVAPANKADRWRGPYLDPSTKLPLLDPWNEPYQYRCPGVHNKGGYDIWSKGPDKTDGTDDDIGNW